MQINIQITGLDAMRQQLGNQAKQANFAASRALNTTAYAINTRLKTDMAATFAGGATAYSLRAFKVEQARKDNLTAAVKLRTDNAGAAVTRTTTTAADGSYRFDGLLAGTYTLTETQPPAPTTGSNGFYDGAETRGSAGGTVVAPSPTFTSHPNKNRIVMISPIS